MSDGLTREVCPNCASGDMRDWLQGPDRFNGRSKLYQLARCSGCSLVFLKNPPLPSEMAQHYGPDYDRLIGRAGAASGRWQARIDVISRYKPGGKLLDLGCSSGSFLASMKGSKWQLFGIEMSTEAARKAEARSGGQVFVGDILEATFAPESFDVITCFDVLEHVYEPRKVVTKVQEWLKPDGVFYLLVPNIDSAAVRVFRSYWYGLELPRHLTHFSPEPLGKMASSVGLRELSASASRYPAVEESIRYLIDEFLRRIGVSRTPLSRASDLGIPWRIARKAMRISILPILRAAISLVGAGEYIHMVYSKDKL